MFTLSIILSKDLNKVLMCKNNKLGVINFIGGKVEELEQPIDASYRELFEETGITRNDVELKFLQTENCVAYDNKIWSLYITYGVLKEDVELVEEKNPLFWLQDYTALSNCGFCGDCLVYYKRAVKALSKEGYK